MKKCFLINLFLLAASLPSLACGGEAYTHNWYMFSMYPHYGGNPAFQKGMEDFWRSYMNNTDTYYWFNRTRALEIAQSKNDTEMVAFLEKMNQYLTISDQLCESWTYPTEEQLQERRRTLVQLASAVDTYKGTRLKPQYMLLAMRANMVLGRYDVNKTFWKNRAQKLPDSPWREMMRNVYANALLHTGQRQQAWDIYAEQGDVKSLRWSVRKFRDIAGIRSIATENPNAPTLRYLVQNFVNDAQETMDWNYEPYPDMLEMTDNRVVGRQDVQEFIKFANQLLDSGATKEPALWKSAVAMLEYQLGNSARAYADASAAMAMAGTDRMLDNARCIRLLAAVGGGIDDNNLPDMLTRELNWLDQKIKESHEEDCYFANAKDRILTQELYRRFKNNGNPNMALAVLALTDANDEAHRWYEGPKLANGAIPANYNSEYYYALDSLSVDELKQYATFIQKQPASPIEQYILPHIDRRSDYFNDLIGTRLLSEGKFAEAIPYLQKVSLKFIEGQNISWYMANRDYTRPAWFYNPRRNGLEGEDGPNNGHITTNKKLDFCHEILQLQGQMSVLKGENRLQNAYNIATRLFQASHKGDCWFLGDYCCSINPLDNLLDDGAVDLTEEAIRYLEMSAQSKDFNMQQESLYALAYIPTDSWADYDWDHERLRVNPDSRQYKAYAQLDDFAKKNAGRVASYITKCDILKEFRKAR